MGSGLRASVLTHWLFWTHPANQQLLFSFVMHFWNLCRWNQWKCQKNWSLQTNPKKQFLGNNAPTKTGPNNPVNLVQKLLDKCRDQIHTSLHCTRRPYTYYYNSFVWVWATHYSPLFHFLKLLNRLQNDCFLDHHSVLLFNLILKYPPTKTSLVLLFLPHLSLRYASLVSYCFELVFG